ncbi:MAG: hypothetical protein F4Z15_05530 [Gammaproteobacteria bacterium]|nr:hypothetical protein [Gammaproteobacteria bacterium]MYD76765.1 hypothetical protein [Gammaproteobacteria bacterium]MYJ51105.1 hypothetical protein [Gammaproteobacteria bacterium]
MSVADPTLPLSGLAKPGLSQSAQGILGDIRQSEQGGHTEGLSRAGRALDGLHSALTDAGAETAGLLASSLARLSQALAGDPCGIDRSDGTRILRRGSRHLARYVARACNRAPLSPLALVDEINRVRSLTGEGDLRPFDVFNPPVGRLARITAQGDAGTDGRTEDTIGDLHRSFRTLLLSWLKERDRDTLDRMAELMGRLARLRGPDSARQLGWLALGFVEAVGSTDEDPDSRIRSRALFAELDLELGRLSRDGSSDNTASPSQELVRKMLYSVGRIGYGIGREKGGSASEAGRGEHLERINKLFGLDRWFADGVTASEQDECRKSMGFAADLSEFFTGKEIRSFQNALTLYFLGDGGERKRAELMARIERLRERTAGYEDGILKTCVEVLCEAIANADVNSRAFFLSEADLKIASALLVLWDLLEDPAAITVERMRAAERRIGEIDRIARRDYPLASDAVDARFEPLADLTRARRVLMDGIGRGPSVVARALKEMDERGVQDDCRETIRSGMKRLGALFTMAGFESAGILTHRAGLLMTEAIESDRFSGSLEGAFAPLVDSIQSGADALRQAGSGDGESEPEAREALKRIEHELEAWSGIGTPEPVSGHQSVREQLDGLGILLNCWQPDDADKGLPGHVREALSTLGDMAKSSGLDGISRLCQAVVPLVRDDCVASASDSAVILNLLLEVHDGMIEEIDAAQAGRKSRVGPLLRMLEQLQDGGQRDGRRVPAEGSGGEEPLAPADFPSLSETSALSGSDTAMKDVFPEETLERMSRIQEVLLDWWSGGFGEDILPELSGVLRDLKSDATVAGHDAVLQVIHALEALSDCDAQKLLGAEDEVLEVLDGATRVIDGCLGSAPAMSEESVATLLERIRKWPGETAFRDSPDGQKGGASPGADGEDPVGARVPADGIMPATGQAMAEALEEPGYSSGLVRLDNEKMAGLLDVSDELVLTNSGLRQALSESVGEFSRLKERMKTIRDGLENLGQEVVRQAGSSPPEPGLARDVRAALQSRIRKLGLQIQRLDGVVHRLNLGTSEMEDSLDRQQRVGERLREELVKARMVRFEEWLPQLERLLGKTAESAGKKAVLTLDSDPVAIDRTLMDAVRPWIEALISNAVVHGIEPSTERIGLGKPEEGRVHITLACRRAGIEIDLSDDGSGLDRERIAGQARKKGLLDGSEELDDDRLVQVVFESGSAGPQQAGMESGLAGVARSVKSRGGSLSLSFEPGRGTAFHFRLPVAAWACQALIVRIGSYRLAVPSRTVKWALRVHSGDLEPVDGLDHVRFGGGLHPVVDMIERIAGMPTGAIPDDRSFVVVRRAGGTFAFAVDEFEDTLEILAQAPGRRLGSIRGVEGVASLVDGIAVPVVDLVEFAEHHEKIPGQISDSGQSGPIG